jgi:hypothetical protein
MQCIMPQHESSHVNILKEQTCYNLLLRHFSIETEAVKRLLSFSTWIPFSWFRFFYSEDGGSRFLQTIGTSIPNYTISTWEVCLEIGTSSVDWAQLSRFHLKTETDACGVCVSGSIPTWFLAEHIRDRLSCGITVSRKGPQ